MVKIIADSTCDLSSDLLEKYNVSIIPLHIVLGEKEYEDGCSIMPDDIFKWSDEHNATPKTSAASMEKAREVFAKYLEEYDEVVSFAISSEMSTTVNVMKLAAQDLEAEERIRVIDSRSLSTGIGLMVIEAAILAQEGKSAVEIEEQILQYVPRVRASFVVDTLVYLHRGGRCSGLAAMLGGAMKLHPMIVVENGKMHSSKKYRGTLNRVISSYSKDLEEALKKARTNRVFITHSECDEEIVTQVQDYLKGLNHFDEVLTTRAGGVISSHCGPGTLGILFIAE
ncbi:MAG: DegV family protein [Lachnospiraceae bacterium]|nr:DegV family protein [Lachnospiraceae bacterium]